MEITPSPPRFRLFGMLVLCGILLGGAALLARPARPTSHSTGGRYVVRSGDDQAPTDFRYRQAVRHGLSGQLAAAKRDLLALEAATRQTSTGAWCLYQAGLAARKQGNRPEQTALWTRLAREYSGHPLTLRTAAGPAAARPVPTLTDCGPRCLARLLQQAGKPADLARLTRACGTAPRGTTLDGLQRAAEQAGLAAVALKVDGAFLARERPRGLAWVERDHFVCFEAESGGTARVWDPNGETTVSQSWDRLARRSQGVVLLVAADKTALPKL